MTVVRNNSRRYAIFSGVSLILMAIIAPIATFGGIEPLLDPVDAIVTARNILHAEGTLRGAILGMMVVALLDVLVSWGIYMVFVKEKGPLSLLTAWMRLLYTAGLIIALALLPLAILAAPTNPGQAQLYLAAYSFIWQCSFIFFSVHLFLLGVLLWRADRFSRITAGLVHIAALGYLIDAVGTILLPGFTPVVGQFTFIGEIVLIIWLFVRGTKVVNGT
jgi:hypothetical protein